MSKTIKMNVITTLDIPVSDVLEAALKHTEIDDVLVIGYETDGDLYVASSSGSVSDIYFMASLAKDFLLKQVIDNE